MCLDFAVTVRPYTHVYLETLGCQNTKITRHIPDTFLQLRYQTISTFLNIHNS